MAASTTISIPTLSAALLLTTLSTQALAQAPAGAPPHGGAQHGGAQGDSPQINTPQVNTIKDVFARLFGCWKPPAANVATPMDITVIVSFNRSGAIMGHPRITYESPKATDRDRVAYRVAVMEALQRCSPMPFTEAMAGAIAGRPLTVQFRTHLKPQEKRAWLSPKIL